MDFPRLVFQVPGNQQRPGGTYGHLLVESQAQFDAALDEGFHETVPEAIAAFENPEAYKAEKAARKEAKDAADKAEYERLKGQFEPGRGKPGPKPRTEE